MSTQHSSQQRHAPSADDVAALCEAVAAAVAVHGDPRTRDQDAEAIRAEVAGISEGTATAVVVGEKKSGKSSLINALVKWPRLLAVDADVATSVHISVGYDMQAAAQVKLVGAATTQPISLSEIGTFAALDPATGKSARDNVEFVSVTVPAPLLQSGLELIDTPGVGGLVAGHTHITRALLRRADALIFVVTAANELTKSELDFLVEATKRIATVFFVVTKIDIHPGWREVLTKNKALLTQYAPAYSAAPWFPVSSRAENEAVTAATLGQEDLAKRRREQSGFENLRECLTSQVAAHAIGLRMRNALHLARCELQMLVQDGERRVRALSLDPRLEQELIDRKRRLAQLREIDAKWRQTLAKSLRELNRDLQLTFQRSLNDMRTLADLKASEASEADTLDELPADIEAAVKGAWLELDDSARNGIGRLITEVSNEIGKADVKAAANLTLPARLQRLPKLIPSANDASGFLATVERAAPALGISALTGTVVAIITGGTALPIVAGIATLAALSDRRKQREALQRARGDAAKYVNRVVSELSTEVPPQITNAVEETGGQLTEAITEQVRQQQLRLEAEQGVLSNSYKLAKDQLAKDKAAATRQLDELRRLLRDVLDLETHIDTKSGGA